MHTNKYNGRVKARTAASIIVVYTWRRATHTCVQAEASQAAEKGRFEHVENEK
jgi:hypothetical protein